MRGTGASLTPYLPQALAVRKMFYWPIITENIKNFIAASLKIIQTGKNLTYVQIVGNFAHALLETGCGGDCKCRDV